MPYCEKKVKYPGNICGQELDKYGRCPNAKNHRNLDNTNKGKGYDKNADTDEAHGMQAKGSWSRN